jgi:hypothetical protein
MKTSSIYAATPNNPESNFSRAPKTQRKSRKSSKTYLLDPVAYAADGERVVVEVLPVSDREGKRRVREAIEEIEKSFTRV